MPGAADQSPSRNLEAFERLVATIPGVERKGATMPYTSLNGHMFSFLTKEGDLALRLPDGVREEFLAKHRTRLCEQHGTVLKEYVVVPDALFAKTKELTTWFARSHGYVGSLKPKPTMRKKAAKKTTKKR